MVVLPSHILQSQCIVFVNIMNNSSSNWLSDEWFAERSALCHFNVIQELCKCHGWTSNVNQNHWPASVALSPTSRNAAHHLVTMIPKQQQSTHLWHMICLTKRAKLNTRICLIDLIWIEQFPHSNVATECFGHMSVPFTHSLKATLHHPSNRHDHSDH